jgi:muconolactone D-isomerase
MTKDTTMLNLVRMDVTTPTELPQTDVDAAQAQEKAVAQDLQRDGRWPHMLWRAVGKYSNFSVFDDDSNDELHNIRQSLALHKFMQIQVTPLAQHPSAITSAR